MNEAERRALFSIHHETIRRFVRRRVPTRHAIDVEQDLAVTVLSHREGPRDRESVVGWCCVAALHIAAHRRRSEARASCVHEQLHDLVRGEEQAATDDDPEHAASMRERLAERLDHLDESAIMLLRDRFVLEETAAEIAARLNVSAAAVKMRLARLVGTLRANDHKSERATPKRRYARRPRGN